MRRWYQAVDVDDPKVVYEDINRKNSKFWNEGKWNSFIKPILPEYKNTFIEIGCNAGLFLKMAKDAGYKNVIGVEGNTQIFSQAESYRRFNGGDYKLIRQKVGVDFDLESLPLSDVVLIANMHYYLPVGVFAKLVDAIRTRTLYCIVVSARAKRRQGNAFHDIKSVHGYFRDWEKSTTICDLDVVNDLCPREQMYGTLFRGGLDVCYVDEIYDVWREEAKQEWHKSYELAPAMEDFFISVLDGDKYDPHATSFYKYWRKRMPKKSGKWTLDHLAGKRFLAQDIQKNGIKEPIYFDGNKKFLDGIHRLCIAKLLGYEYVLSRTL